MEIELGGRKALIIGRRNQVALCVADALEVNGANVAWDSGLTDANKAFDILVVSHNLNLAEPPPRSNLLEQADTLGSAMAPRQLGRIVHLMSALGVVAMRRYPALSVEAAAIAASVRTQAMRLAPQILVNAVAVGTIGEEAKFESGHAAMLSHVPVGKLGSALDVAHAVLFLLDPANTYTTGQVLTVDGGWTAGYGRNF